MKSIIQNKRSLAVGLVILGTIVAGTTLYSDDKNGIVSDVSSQELRSITIESFEKDLWRATALPGAPQSKVEIKQVAGIPKNLGNEAGNKNSMGLRFQFVYPGNNSIVLLPPESKTVRRYVSQLSDDTNERKFYDVPGIELPGIVKAISIWVLGRGDDYTLEAWIEDWKGDTHIYNFGSMNFIGWRPLTITIPNSVPQEADAFPQTKGLILKKMVIRSTPKTKTDNKTIFFFDSIKVLTDMYDVFFDGADIDFDDEDRQNKAKMQEYVEQLKSNSTSSNGN